MTKQEVTFPLLQRHARNRIPMAIAILDIRFSLALVFASAVMLSMAQSNSVTHRDVITTTYSSILDDIQALNVSCFPKDSCRLDKASRISDVPDLEKRNCLCDELCSQFGDCCPDSKRFAPGQQPLSAARFSCLQFKQYNFNWIVNKCPSDWMDAEVAQGCEEEATEWQVHQDPIGHMPVTSTTTGITYRNLNCATCHGDIPRGHLRRSAGRNQSPQLRFWNPRLECSSILAGNSHISRVPKEALASKVQWDGEQKMWGLYINLDGRGEEFHPCFVDPSLPDDLQPFLRPCQPSTDECPPEWKNDDVRQKCRSYTSFVYLPQEVYRNVHCAVCNGIQPQDLSCNSTGIAFRQLPLLRDFNPSAFALLFDLKDNDGSGIVGQQKSCLDGQLYDPFSRKCRQVYCSQSGTVYRNGRCLQDESSVSVATTTVSSSTVVSGELEKPSIPPTHHWATTDVAGPVTEHSANPFSSTTLISSSLGGLPVNPAISATSTSASQSAKNPAPSKPSDADATTKPGDDNAFGVVTDTLNETNFTSCPKFLLSENELEWGDNGTLFVTSYNRTFEPGQYERIEDGGVLICALGQNTVSKFDPILGWVTVAGLGLSEICLALHLIAFVLSPELRNLSGRNLASLSLALFGAYGSFIGAQFVPVGGRICVGSALSTYYFFLAAFWWTSVLAWDVWRTIRLATVQLRCSSSSQQWGKFIGYSMYAWLFPGLVVTLAVLVDFVDVGPRSWVPTEYHPHFGRSVCWFGQRKSILVFFAIPLAAILFFNLLLFISSAYMIRSTTAKSPTSNNQTSSRKQLGLYVRLALIMGLSWIAGLIAGAADFMPLWYVFVGLCSLQGLFILLAYTCNPKVSRSIRSRVLFCPSSAQRCQSTYRTALVGGLKDNHLRRLGLEARDSHDSQVSNTSQASQTSQTSLTKTSCSSSSP